MDSVSFVEVQYKILTIALILWRLGYVLRTLNTLSQVMGYSNYRVSLYAEFGFDILILRDFLEN